MPEVLLRFFGVLFKFDPQSFDDTSTRTINESTIVEEEEDDDDDNDDVEDKDEAEENVQGLSDMKRRKIRVLHQIIYFNVHNGTKRTPLHILNAQSIHDKCKELITSFNHYGLAISYNELQRYHNDIASFIV